MTSKRTFDTVNGDTREQQSPARKRTRLDPSVAETIGLFKNKKPNEWSICDNNLTFEDMTEIGVGQLESDSEGQSEIEPYPDFLDLTGACLSTKARIEKDKRIAAMLQTTISKETLQSISTGKWNDFLIQKPKRELIFKVNHFQQLSDEVVLHIFYWLPKRSLANAALVCRRWHRLAQDESLWTRMDLSGRSLEPGALGHILSRQAVILRLTQSEISQPAILPGVKAATPEFKARLLYLDLSMVHITPSSLIMLFSKCQRLKKLSLEHVYINDEVCRALSHNKELEVLNLAMADGLHKMGLSHLLTNCCKLKELNLAWTYLDAASIQYVCAHLPSTLDRLNLSGCRKLLNDENILHLVSYCPNLRELDLSDSTGLTGQVINSIIQLQNLNFLALSRCYFIPYRSLLRLKVMHSLKYLDIHGGFIDAAELEIVQNTLGDVNINKFKFSSIARPTVGPKRSSIWNLRVRE